MVFPSQIAVLAFGMSENPFLSYVIHMDLVVGDIEEVTGVDVIEPKFAGTVWRDYANLH